MKYLNTFEKIAPHLTHPLVLAGFALFLLFGLLYALLRSDKLSPLGKTQSSRLLERVVLGGFVVAILVIVLGFALAFWRSPTEPDVYRLRVTVLAPDGTPVAEAEVGSTVGGEVRRGGGIWELVVPRSSVPADGRIEVRASRGAERGATEVVLDADPQPAVTVRLEPPPEVAIRGTVVDGDGHPVAGARVSVDGRGGVETDGDGAFELPALAPEGDMVRLRVTAKGFRVLEEHVLAGARAKRLELELEEER